MLLLDELVSSSVCVSSGCWNESPQTEQLKMTQLHSLTLQNSEIKVSQGWFLLEALREKQTHASLPVSGGCWQSLVFFGL